MPEPTPRQAQSFADDCVGSRRISWALFGAFSCLYLLLGGGHVYTPDGVVMLQVSRALVDRGAADIEPLPNWPSFGGLRVRDPLTGDERFYAKYGLGQSLVALPALALGRALARWVPEDERSLFDTPIGVPEGVDASDPESFFSAGNPFRVRWYDWSAEAWPLPFEAFAASWTNALLAAGTVALLFLLALQLGYSQRTAAGAAVLLGLATPLAHYAKTFFAEPLVAFALTAFALLAVRVGARACSARVPAAAGLALGACVLAKVALVVVVPLGVALCAVLWWPPSPGDRRTAAMRGVAFLAGLALPLLIIAAYDLARFGTLLETGYGEEASRWTTPLWEGLAGLLVSPGRGLFVYAPILLASLAGGVRFWRRAPALAAFAIAATAALLLSHARWYMWEGGWCWGPRFLVPLLPLLVLPVAESIDAARRAGTGPRLALAALAVASGAVAASGLVVNFVDFHHWVKLAYEFRAAELQAMGAADYYDLVRWHWDFSPLVATWSFPVKDYLLLPHAWRQPGFVLGLHGLFAVALAASVLQLQRALRGGKGLRGEARDPLAADPLRGTFRGVG